MTTIIHSGKLTVSNIATIYMYKFVGVNSGNLGANVSDLCNTLSAAVQNPGSSMLLFISQHGLPIPNLRGNLQRQI